MLKENQDYIIQPRTVTIGDIVFKQDEVIKVLELSPSTVKLLRYSTGEIIIVDKRAIEIVV
ncbi:hypothetical protein [Fusobacterium varium]|uniref:hypothetical protein n=1 Tax=Fusobacterium varium TaxID=856 RepID=UPI00266C9353|nr:hypothetical protein [Fusobacterium varium]